MGSKRASAQAAEIDHERKVLRYAGADIVPAACLRVPITRELVGGDGLITDPAARARIAEAVAALVARVRARAS